MFAQNPSVRGWGVAQRQSACLAYMRSWILFPLLKTNKQTTEKKMKIAGLDSILGWMELRT